MCANEAQSLDRAALLCLVMIGCAVRFVSDCDDVTDCAIADLQGGVSTT